MHDTNDDTPIYRDQSGEGEELRRAMSHACVGLRPPTQISFDPAEGGWPTFYTDFFTTEIAPHFVAVYNAALAGESDKIIDLDQQFSRRIPKTISKRLADAASAVFEARDGAGAMRLLDRLRDRRPDCTFTSAFAAHAASFHVPLLHAIIAYLAVEWRSGKIEGTPGLEKSGDWQTLFERDLLSAPEPVRQVLARNLGGWSEVA